MCKFTVNEDFMMSASLNYDTCDIGLLSLYCTYFLSVIVILASPKYDDNSL